MSMSPPRPVDIYDRLQVVRFGPPPEPNIVNEEQDRADVSGGDDDMPAIPDVSNTIPKPAEPEPNRLMRSGQTDPSAMRANLDDPPIHIRPICSGRRGFERQEPMGSMLLSTPIVAPTNLGRHQILRNFCHESVRKGLRIFARPLIAGAPLIQRAGQRD
jgi:hypothetical protein